MKNSKIALLGLFSIFSLSACDSDQHISWTPDGKRMAVLGSSLRIGDANGALSKSLMPGVDSCQWFADGHHALLKRHRSEKNWTALAPLLTPSERKQAILVAERLRTGHGTIKSFEKQNPDADKSGGAALVYINTKYGAKALSATFRNWQIPLKDSIFSGEEITTLQIVDVAGGDDLSNCKLTPGKVLLESRKTVDSVILSPDGKFVAFSKTINSKHETVILSVNNGLVKTVNARDVYPAAWSSDSRSLMLVETPDRKTFLTLANESLPASTLNKVTVADTTGKLLPVFPVEKAICSIPYATNLRMATLPDGKFLFASLVLRLPTIDTNKTSQQSLFKLDVLTKTLETIPLENKSLADCLGSFVLNQDGTRVALVTSKKAIYVLDLQSGKSALIEKANEAGLAFQPNWRSATELCHPLYCSASEKQSNGNDHDYAVALTKVPSDLSTSPSDAVPLSAKWPASEIDFLRVSKDKYLPTKKQK